MSTNSQHDLSIGIIDVVARARVRLRVMQGIYWAASIVIILVANLAMFASLDYLLRPNRWTARLGLSMVFVASTLVPVAWVIYRFLTSKMSLIQLARRLEQSFPVLRDRLSSALSFVHNHGEAVLDSIDLRAAMIDDVRRVAERLPINSAFDARPVRVMLARAIVVTSLWTLALWASPCVARFATSRVLTPWSSDTWPKINHLEFVDAPTLLAQGEDLELRLVDSDGTLPKNVNIHYRFKRDGRRVVETKTMRLDRGIMVARRPEVNTSLQYWATGGDDKEMQPISLRVVPPPAIQSIAWTITPPSYTRWPKSNTQTLGPVLAGSQIEFEMQATSTLREASLLLDGKESVPLTLSRQGNLARLISTAKFTWGVHDSQCFRFRLTDTLGLSVTTPEMRIHVRLDQPPDIKRQTLSSDSDAIATATGITRLAFRATDDIALCQISIQTYVVDGKAPRSTRLIYQGRAFQGTPTPEEVWSGRRMDKQEISHAYYMAETSTKPGDVLLLRAVVTDFAGQETRSPIKRITIVSLDEFQKQLSQELSDIVASLERIAQNQATLQRHLDGFLDKPNSTNLQFQAMSTVAAQNRLVEAISGTAGITEQLYNVLADARDNRLENSPLFFITAQAVSLLRDQALVDMQEAHQALRNYARTVSTVELSKGSTPAQDGGYYLRRASTAQTSSVEELVRVADLLRQTTNHQDILETIRKAQTMQQRLLTTTRHLGPHTIGRGLESLSVAERDELDQLSLGQQKIHSLFGTIRGLLDGTPHGDNQDPLATSREQARGLLARTDIDSLIDAAANSMATNRLGSSLIQQQIILDILAELEQLFRKPLKDSTPSSLIDLLRTSEKLGKAARQQTLAVNAFDQARKNVSGTSLAEMANSKQLQQQALKTAMELAELMRSLDNLSEMADLSQVISDMQAALKAAESNDAQTAHAFARRAAEGLQDTKKEFTAYQKNLQQQQIGKLEAVARIFDELVTRQTTLRNRTIEAQKGREREPLTTERNALVEILSAEQQDLRNDTSSIGAQSVESAVFLQAARFAAEKMADAEALLVKGKTGKQTQELQQHALQWLTLVVDSLAETAQAIPQPESPTPPPDSNQAAEDGSDKGPSVDPRLLPELKIVRRMQEQLNMEYNVFSRQKRLGELTREEADQHAMRLANQQIALSSLVHELLHRSNEKPQSATE